MKKTLIVLMTLIFVLPLSACSVSGLMHSIGSDLVDKDTDQVAIIKKNSQVWEKEIAGMQVVESDEHGDSRGRIASSMTELKKSSKSVIQGTIINFEKMNNPKNVAYTKATIHIDDVISGDKQLKGQNIQMALNSGITSTTKWFADKNQTREVAHDILVQYDEFPLPKIGTKIIVGIDPAAKDEPSPYNMALKRSKFDYQKSYVAIMPEYNLWIKKSSDRKYHLNNPKVAEKLKSNVKMKQGLTKLTETINQKYNK